MQPNHSTPFILYPSTRVMTNISCSNSEKYVFGLVKHKTKTKMLVTLKISILFNYGDNIFVLYKCGVQAESCITSEKIAGLCIPLLYIHTVYIENIKKKISLDGKWTCLVGKNASK